MGLFILNQMHLGPKKSNMRSTFMIAYFDDITAKLSQAPDQALLAGLASLNFT